MAIIGEEAWAKDAENLKELHEKINELAENMLNEVMAKYRANQKEDS
jgi:hypothetical protein